MYSFDQFYKNATANFVNAAETFKDYGESILKNLDYEKIQKNMSEFPSRFESIQTTFVENAEKNFAFGSDMFNKFVGHVQSQSEKAVNDATRFIKELNTK
jgi:hypothetical protein